MANNYKSLNQQNWEEGGLGYAGEMAQVRAEQEKIANDPIKGQAFTPEELKQLYGSAGITDNGTYSQKAQVMPWDDAAAAGITLKPTADPNYGYVDGTPRQAKEGDSEADETFLSDADYQLVQYYKSEWNRYNELAKQETDPVKKQEYLTLRDQQNEAANRVRLRYDYSGGADGSMYLTKGELGLAGNEYRDYETGGAGNRNPSGAAGTSSDLKSLLDAWQQAAMQQSNGQIDYAVAKAVADLERALADAQPQFKEQAESVDRDARQAMDNSALYAEMRGDKGGIGQEQYNSIQNTQAQNHLAVQQAQTKLATDTQRQIADLRAQGEFEKANAALEITQNYLAQLISLEQWAAEYNLSVAQFQASLQQWEAEYNMAMQQLQISQNQWQAEFDYTKQLNSQNQLAGMGEALLSAGIPLTDEQLKAMGITGEQASQLLIQQQLAAAQKGSGGGGGDPTTNPVDGQSVYGWLYSANAKDYGTAYEALRNAGYNTTDADRYAKYYTETWLGEYTPTPGTVETPVVSTNPPKSEEEKRYDDSKTAMGIATYRDSIVVDAILAGIIKENDDGSIAWAPGWNKDNWMKHYVPGKGFVVGMFDINPTYRVPDPSMVPPR